MVRTFTGKFFNALVLVLVLTLAVPWAAFADEVVIDGDTVASGDQSTVSLGTVAPGATLTPQVSFTLKCSNKSHLDSGQKLSLNFSGAKLNGSSVDNTVITAGTASIGGAPESWPDDTTGAGSTNCPVSAPAPLQDNGNSQVTIVAPSTPASYTAVLTFNHALSPEGSSDSSSIKDSFTTVTYTFTVAAPTNRVPTATPHSVSTNEDTAHDITLSATDSDGNDLTYSIISGPSNGTLSPVSGNQVTYTPATNYNGQDSFSFKANDGTADSNTATVSITVSPVNDNPVPAGDTAITPEDTVLFVTQASLIANDSRGAENESAQTLTVSQVSNAINGSVRIVPSDAAAHAGEIEFTPAANYNGNGASFDYKVCDNGSPQACSVGTAKVTVTVNAVNDAPVAQDGSVTTNEDTAGDVTLSATDVDSSSLTYEIVSGPSHGTLSGTGANRTYTPAANYYGADSFTFMANDGSLDSNVATVSIRVDPVNDNPVAVNDTATVDEDSTGSVIDVLANDSDGVDGGETLTVTVVGAAEHGKATLIETGANAGKVSYTPNANYYGADSFTYTISDGNGGVGTATVWITVTAVNDAPVAVDDTKITDEDKALMFPSSDLLANDSEGAANESGQTLTVTAVTATADTHGIVSLSGPGGTITYTPTNDYNGAASFQYTVKDNAGGTDTATAYVKVTVTAVNDAPVAQNDTAATAEDTAKVITLSASDVDSTTLTYSIVAGPSYGSLSAVSGNKVTYTPNADYNGSDSFTFKADDGSLDSNVATVSITVTAVNDAPSVSNTTLTVDSTSRVANTTATYSDVDLGDTHKVIFTYKEGSEVILTTAPRSATGGSVSDQSLLPARCYSNLTVTVTVTDSGNLKDSDTSTAKTVDVYSAAFQAPIKDNERNLAKAGSVVPVKVTLTSSCAPGTTITTATLYVQVVKGIAPGEVTAGEEVIPVTVISADSSTQMRISGGTYIYNLSAKALTTGQDYTIQIRLGASNGPIILTAALRTYK